VCWNVLYSMKVCINILAIAVYLIGFHLYASPNSKTTRWINDVVLGPEFEGGGETVSLWTRPPNISVIGDASKEHLAIVHECINEINLAIKGTNLDRLKMVAQDDSDAEILIYFVSIKDFPTIAKKHNFNYVKGNLGYFWTFWNASNEIKKAIVMISSDRLDGKLLKHFTLEEITQSLGLSNDSKEFNNSIFYSNPSNTTKLSKDDKLLLKFAYTHLKPGMNKKDVKKALRDF